MPQRCQSGQLEGIHVVAEGKCSPLVIADGDKHHAERGGEQTAEAEEDSGSATTDSR